MGNERKGGTKEDSSIVGTSNWTKMVPVAGNGKAGEGTYFEGKAMNSAGNFLN